MRIAVVSANGRVGRLVVHEAVARGHEVTAVVRAENKTEATAVIQKDLFNLEAPDLADFDVVVDAFGAWQEETLSQHSASLAHLCDVLSGTPVRLLVVGGAGSLYTDRAHTRHLMDNADFPASFLPLASAMGKSLDELRKRFDVRWTYLSPAADFKAEGERTGSYVLAGEELTNNERGESVISYADFAIAMVDEAERADGSHVGKRISVVRA